MNDMICLMRFFICSIAVKNGKSKEKNVKEFTVYKNDLLCLKNFIIFVLCSKSIYCEEHLICIQLLLKWLQEVIVQDFLSGLSLSKQSDLVILQKYQSLSNQCFKHNSTHIPSLNLIPRVSFERTFPMFIINYYYTKRKHLEDVQSLDSLLFVSIYTQKHVDFTGSSAIRILLFF